MSKYTWVCYERGLNFKIISARIFPNNLSLKILKKVLFFFMADTTFRYYHKAKIPLLLLLLYNSKAM